MTGQRYVNNTTLIAERNGDCEILIEIQFIFAQLLFIMGTVAAVHHALNDGCLMDNMLIDKELQDCAKAFVVVPESRSDFTSFLKDGFWSDYLLQTNLLYGRSKHAELKTFSATLRSVVVRKFNDVSLLASITASRASDSKDFHQSDTNGVFSELYANVEGRTCFAHEAMQSFLFSIICPLYLENCKDFEMLQHGEENVDNDLPCELGHQSEEMHRLQDILLGSAAYYDEFELTSALSSTSWLDAIRSALQDCELPIVICRVDTPTAATSTAASSSSISMDKVFTPVLINTAAARRRDPITSSSSSSSKKSSKHEQDLFCQLWGIGAEEKTSAEMSHCLQSAQPMRIVSVGEDNTRGKAAAPSVLEVTHIFDDSGAHCYVLGMQMNLSEAPSLGSVPSASLEKELRYLSDSALLVAHLLKPSASATGSGRIVTLMRTCATVK